MFNYCKNRTSKILNILVEDKQDSIKLVVNKNKKFII